MWLFLLIVHRPIGSNIVHLVQILSLPSGVDRSIKAEINGYVSAHQLYVGWRSLQQSQKQFQGKV